MRRRAWYENSCRTSAAASRAKQRRVTVGGMRRKGKGLWQILAVHNARMPPGGWKCCGMQDVLAAAAPEKRSMSWKGDPYSRRPTPCSRTSLHSGRRAGMPVRQHRDRIES